MQFVCLKISLTQFKQLLVCMYGLREEQNIQELFRFGPVHVCISSILPQLNEEGLTQMQFLFNNSIQLKFINNPLKFRFKQQQRIIERIITSLQFSIYIIQVQRMNSELQGTVHELFLQHKTLHELLCQIASYSKQELKVSVKEKLKQAIQLNKKLHKFSKETFLYSVQNETKYKNMQTNFMRFVQDNKFSTQQYEMDLKKAQNRIQFLVQENERIRNENDQLKGQIDLNQCITSSFTFKEDKDIFIQPPLMVQTHSFETTTQSQIEETSIQDLSTSVISQIDGNPLYQSRVQDQATQSLPIKMEGTEAMTQQIVQGITDEARETLKDLNQK